MSRSGYEDYDGDYSEIMQINWRGAILSAMRGKRGQAFLREMLAALDAMSIKRLIKEELILDGEVCAMGAVARARGMDLSYIDPEDPYQVSGAMNIAPAMAGEIAYYNDEAFYGGYRVEETPEGRWIRMRAWIVSQIKTEKTDAIHKTR